MHPLTRFFGTAIAVLALLAAAAQCGSRPGSNAAAPSGGEPVPVVATTGIVADIVQQVGGSRISLTTLLPVGVDPHSFEPTPRDLATVANARLVFTSGVGLESFMDALLKNAGGQAEVVAVSDGVELRRLTAAELAAHQAEEAGEAHAEEDVDPHTWTSPANARIFVDNIRQALSRVDPVHAAEYQANARTYQARLDELDRWVQAQIDTIPAENRILVTDHVTFGYYADRYGLQQAGAVIPAFSAAAEPSAANLAALTDAIKRYHVKAIFVGNTVNPILARQIAADTGVKLVPLYTGSLGPAGSGAESYLDYIRYNTTAIVEALR